VSAETDPSVVKPTVNLRFVMREGKRILQQQWLWLWGGETEWRDVPLEEEKP
jgi:hypothetical protein